MSRPGDTKASINYDAFLPKFHLLNCFHLGIQNPVLCHMLLLQLNHSSTILISWTFKVLFSRENWLDVQTRIVGTLPEIFWFLDVVRIDPETLAIARRGISLV